MASYGSTLSAAVLFHVLWIFSLLFYYDPDNSPAKQERKIRRLQQLFLIFMFRLKEQRETFPRKTIKAEGKQYRINRGTSISK